MLFNTTDFILFLVLGWVGYRLVQHVRLPRLLWLLVISCFFYSCWHPWYLLLVAASTLLDYGAGAMLVRSANPRVRKAWLAVAIVGDVALLGVFKYGNFALESVGQLAALAGHPVQLPALDLELPVGISFYTFQTMSYSIDLYRRRIPPARSLLDFSVYVIFFPQLVAGPIVRAADFLPQLDARPRLDPKALGDGLFLILAGLTKKMILADTLSSTIVQPFFASPGQHGTVEALVALTAANFQVYCDFSGYSDVAIGAALMFGFVLPKNFDRPFSSQSPMEHWRRWHISLSTWLKDYLYVPLGGSRGGELRTDVNLAITFLIGGIWHGAGWTFVIWGLYNGVLLAAWRRWGPRREAKTWWGRGLLMIATFYAICFGLVFLHAHSFADAAAVLADLGRPLTWGGGVDKWGLLALGAAFVLHFTPPQWKEQLQEGFGVAPAWSLGLVTVMAGGLLSLFAGLAQPFFYFQF